jgi:predicted PurR-regulated permease PerM
VSAEPKRPWKWANRRVRLEGQDPSPFEDPAAFWRVMAQVATIAMFLIFFGALLYFARPFLLPVLSAIVVGMTVGPIASWAARRGVPQWATALATVLAIIAVVYLAIVTLSQPASELIARSGEIGAAVKDKFELFERPLAALRDLQAAVRGGPDDSVKVDTTESAILAGIVAIITPAAIQIVVFLGTLFFFMLGRSEFRQYIVNFFGTREGRLRALKILNAIEHNLSTYLITVTIINLCVGIFAVAVTYLLGLPNPVLLGVLAFVLNYLPYIGPGIVHVILFVLGLLTYPTLWWALLPPAIFILFTIIEGQFIMPNIVGRQLDLRPLPVFLNLAFWAWLWGPIGAFLAMPILIVLIVVTNHLYPKTKDVLPD